MPTEKKHRTLIVDDHKIFRDGLKMLLSTMPEIGIIDEASTGREFTEAVEKFEPDLVFLDVGLPDINGIRAAEQLSTKNKFPKIIILSNYDESDLVLRSLKTGISGYLLKTADYSEISAAVKAVVSGKNYFCSEVIENIKENNAGNNIKYEFIFTTREKEILNLICAGLSTEKIAEKLFLSRRTIEKHKQNLMQKIGTHSTSSLILFAINNSLT